MQQGTVVSVLAAAPPQAQPELFASCPVLISAAGKVILQPAVSGEVILWTLAVDCFFADHESRLM